MVTSPSNLPRTVGELRAAGHRERGVKQEIRENLLTALADGDEVWPGILGFDDTVIPQVERALIAGHDFVLLGERGQGKTRLLRALTGLLDEWTPVMLLRLYFRNPALEIQRVKMPADQSVIAGSSYDYVFDYRNDHLLPVSSHRLSPDEVRALITR